VRTGGESVVVLMRKFLCVALAGIPLLVTNTVAKPVEKTKYKFYTISGDTPGEIYSSMIKRGPDVNGVNAYASTNATSQQAGRLVLQGKSCRVDSYTFTINFVINLPKLKNEKALSGPTAENWVEFKTFLKTHEETHRSLWLDCARDLETKVMALRTSDCKKLDKEAARLWKNMRKACDKKHAAFDAAEQKKLVKHPFVKMVLGQRHTSTKALEAN
jgi:predicted secreted Zn-dependent protease